MLEALGERPGKSLPTAFQDWANTKAAYRFFSNGNVSEDKIMEGHFAASAVRIAATDGPILILQDTTEFSFKRSAPERIGFTKISTGRKLEEGRYQKHAVCGLLMHASLAITPEGLPLGLTAAKFWSRAKFKGTAALKRRINPTRVPIEQKESMRWLNNLRLSTELAGAPGRCVHIGDREVTSTNSTAWPENSGPTSWSATASTVWRRTADGETTISKVMAQIRSSGSHEIRFRDAQGQEHRAVLTIKHATMTVCPPIGKQRKYRHQPLQIIHAEELDPPEGRTRVFWKLITNLPVESHAQAVHKLEWYALRWKIETFFRTLKIGCRIEDIRLATADRLANCIALCCIVAWRVSWLTMLNRGTQGTSPAAVFTEDERGLLERAIPDRKRGNRRDLDFYVRALARLGGYLDRAADPPPGTTVIWRGFSRLADLVEGARLANNPDICG